MLSKEKVRKKILLLRKKKYFLVSEAFFKPLVSLIKKKRKKSISLYYPSNYEVDTIKLFGILRSKTKLTTSLPIISSQGYMRFSKWGLSEPLKVNSYGFLEPTENMKIVNPDLIVVPLVAFDKFHNRLGYGKGYYDRFLGKYLKKNKNTLTIGIAFSFQKYKKIPTSKFDIKLDYILTEKGIF
tara:strand:+ start:692 stop:1240 length:549 start_codon:yes stop_codon:yes gene_type:complete